MPAKKAVKSADANQTAEAAKPAKSFEQALVRLEEIADRLENGNLSLELALDYYEESIQLIKYCSGLLAKSEKRIEVLTKVSGTKAPGGQQAE